MIPARDRFVPFLESKGLDVIVADVRERMEAADLLRYAGQFDATICGDDVYSAEVLQACAPRLRVISKWGTGIDSIDADACRRLGIRVYRTPDAFTQSVADTVLGYVLAFARRLPSLDREMHAGRWTKLSSKALNECTLGVVGVGHIGKAVARRAKPFGLRLLGNDIVEVDPAFIRETGIEMTGLARLLASSDFVSLNCDLNPTSRHLMNEQTFSMLRTGAVLINTARGPLVDEAALIRALETRRLAGAALDVFEVEPLPSTSPLLSMDNVMLAPHNANSSPAAWERVHTSTMANLFEGLGISAEEPAPR
jgi:D-3-phosphoglycerate dehydrogenase